MYTLTFANGKVLEALDGVLSMYDSSMGEQRDAFSFMVRASDIAFDALQSLVGDAGNTKEILLTNDAASAGVSAETGTSPASEAYYGYINLMTIRLKRHTLQEGLLNVPAAFEWVYEVMLAEQTNTQKQAPAVDLVLSALSDADAARNVDAFPLWTTMGRYDGVRYTGEYESGYRARYSELLYRRIKTHSLEPRQSDWNPADAASLWRCISDPGEDFPVWKQPAGSTDAYDLGVRVTHKNRRWISALAVNVWEPGVYGWEEVV